MAGCLHHQSQADQEIVMSFARVNIEVHGLAGAVVAFCLLYLKPEFLAFRGAIGGIDLQPPRIDSRQELKANLRLAPLLTNVASSAKV